MRIIRDWYLRSQPVQSEQGLIPFSVHRIDVVHACQPDEKRRVIGGYAMIVDRRPLSPPEAQSFELLISSTKDGLAHGAIRPGTFLITLAIAKRQALRRLARQGQAYRRKYGPSDPT